MTARKKTETSDVASTPAERENRHDATGTLLEKQQAAGETYRTNKAGETPDVAVAEPVKPPKRKTISVRAACRKYPEVRELFVHSLAHLFGHEAGDTYNLAAFMGTAAGVRILIADHIKQRVPTQRAEQRMNGALSRYKIRLQPAPDEVVQKLSVNPRTGKELVPQLKRPTGPSNYAETLAVVFEIRALEAITSKDALLQCKKQVVSAQMALDHSVETWHPFRRAVPFDREVRAKVEAHEKEHASTVRSTDENGEQILKARLHLATCEIVVRQREAMLARLKEVRKEHAWIVGVLGDVHKGIEAEVSAQLRRDGLSEQQHARGMIAAGWDTRFDGTPYADCLTDDNLTTGEDGNK